MEQPLVALVLLILAGLALRAEAQRPEQHVVIGCFELVGRRGQREQVPDAVQADAAAGEIDLADEMGFVVWDEVFDKYAWTAGRPDLEPPRTCARLPRSVNSDQLDHG